MSGNSVPPPIGPPPSVHYPPPTGAPIAPNGLKYQPPQNYTSPYKQEQPPSGSTLPPPPSTNAMYPPPPMTGPPTAPIPSSIPPSSSAGSSISYAPPPMTGPPLGPPPTGAPPSYSGSLPPPTYAGPPLSASVGPPLSQTRLGNMRDSIRPPALDTAGNESYAGNLFPAPLQLRSKPSTPSFATKTSPSNNNLSLTRPESATSIPRNQSSSEFSTGSGSGMKKSSRIDPAQMPRPDKALNDVVYHTRSGSGRRNPPSCNTIYKAVDTGNCLPRHLRVTMVAPPTTKELLTQTALPFAVLSTPFAQPENGEEEVPIVTMADFEPTADGESQSPPRCTRCRGYVNPNVVFTDAGNKWTCNLCSMSNVVPSWYYYAVDGNGLRMDRQQRPELQLGSIEFVVNKDYCIRPLQDPIYVFAIDISDRAVANGTTMASLKAVHSAIFRLKEIELINSEKNSQIMANKSTRTTTGGIAANNVVKNPSTNNFGSQSSLFSLGSNKAVPTAPVSQPAASFDVGSYKEIRVGIVTFNSTIQFYSVNNREHSPDPIRISVGDASDPFAMLPTSHWLYSVNSQWHFVEKLLSRLPELIVSLQDTPVDANGYQRTTFTSIEEENLCCPTAAIKAIQSGLEKTGGRIFVLTNSHSTIGYGKFPRFRENINHYQNLAHEIALYGSTTTIASMMNRSGSSFNIPLPGTTNSKPTVQQSQQDELRALCELYSNLGVDCAKSVCSVNLYAMLGESYNTSSYFDGALMSEPCTKTGGRFFLVAGNMAADESIVRLTSQLTSDLISFKGCEAVVKLRCSVGVKVDEYYGQGYQQTENGSDEVEFSSLDRSTSVMFTLKSDASLKDEDKVHLQLATLYTNSLKQRVVRIHNITLVSSNKLPVIYRNSDIETVVVALMKISLNNALNYPLADESKGSRLFLQTKLIDVLFNYRRYCSSTSPRGQLILPESLKVLPIYTLGMIKHPSLVENKIGPNGGAGSGTATPRENSTPRLINTSSDYSVSGGGLIRVVAIRGFERSFEIRKLMNLSSVDIINSLYPRMYSLLTLLGDDSMIGASLYAPSVDSIDFPFEPTNIDKMRSLLRSSSTTSNMGDVCAFEKEHLKLQQTIYPSSELFEADQIYLLDDKSTFWLYIGRNVSQSTIMDVFSISEDNPYERPESAGFNTESEIGRKIHNFVELLRSMSTYKQDVRLIWADIRSDNPMISKFSSRLVEDSLYGKASYVDYLCTVHTRIQARLT